MVRLNVESNINHLRLIRAYRSNIMKKIIIADDESRIRRLVSDFLVNNHYLPLEAEDGDVALKLFRKHNDVSLIILDIMMPNMDGWAVCKEIRKTSQVPIILLTARSQEFDELMGFETGADDYVTKPFSPVILMKRIDALIRRSENVVKESSETIEIDNLTINKYAHEVYIDSKPTPLALKEYNILLKLSQNIGRVYTREQILDDVWGFDFTGDVRTVDSHMARLRTKLGSWGDKHLKTIYGTGYKIELNSNNEE